MEIRRFIKLLEGCNKKADVRVIVDASDRDGVLLASVLSSTIGREYVLRVGDQNKEGDVENNDYSTGRTGLL
ncbi:MAG: hypothetical protein IJV14_10890 [Lachnospiraceae bacterium]|nr:hypothetical protein [Lachnospiraceae bacterium]